MRNLLAKMIIKINKRIFATTIGIALCVMYLVGTMSMVAGLHEGTKNTADLFEKGFLVVYDGYTLSESKIDSDEILALSGKKKEEPSVPAEEGELTDKKKETKTPETPVKEIPWIYVAAGVAGILAVLSIYKILKK